MPNPWQTGVSVSAISKEPNPATGNAVKLTIKLHGDLMYKPPKGSPFHEPIHAIKLGQTVVDSKLGTKLANATTIFGFSAGMIEVTGQNFGTPVVLRLEDWSGLHSRP
jgi:hypothetical protein